MTRNPTSPTAANLGYEDQVVLLQDIRSGDQEAGQVIREMLEPAIQRILQGVLVRNPFLNEWRAVLDDVIDKAVNDSLKYCRCDVSRSKVSSFVLSLVKRRINDAINRLRKKSFMGAATIARLDAPVFDDVDGSMHERLGDCSGPEMDDLLCTSDFQTKAVQMATLYHCLVTMHSNPMHIERFEIVFLREECCAEALGVIQERSGAAVTASIRKIKGQLLDLIAEDLVIDGQGNLVDLSNPMESLLIELFPMLDLDSNRAIKKAVRDLERCGIFVNKEGQVDVREMLSKDQMGLVKFSGLDGDQISGELIYDQIQTIASGNGSVSSRIIVSEMSAVGQQWPISPIKALELVELALANVVRNRQAA